MTPTTHTLNRINSLQNIANSFGYVLAMNTADDIDIAAKELSDIIVSNNAR